MDTNEFKYNLVKSLNRFKIIIVYFLKEPFFELTRVVQGYYNSTLLFYLSLIGYFYIWKSGIGGWKLKIAGLTLFLSYFYMFVKSEKWKDYYQKEYVEGKEILSDEK